jgi:hypothetical protein
MQADDGRLRFSVAGAVCEAAYTSRSKPGRSALKKAFFEPVRRIVDGGNHGLARYGPGPKECLTPFQLATL